MDTTLYFTVGGLQYLRDLPSPIYIHISNFSEIEQSAAEL